MKSLGVAHDFFFQQEKKNSAVSVCKSYELMKLLIS